MNIPENIHIDFLHELKFVTFPLSDLIKKNDRFTALIEKEFARLQPRPKPYLYVQDLITDKQWETSVAESHARASVSGPGTVAAPVVARTATERRYYQLMEQFQEAIANQSLAEKYYGRLITETPTVQLLKKINEQAEVFKKYIFRDLHIPNYQAYGNAAAKSIVASISKINDMELKMALLDWVMASSIDVNLVIEAMFDRLSSTEQEEAKGRFIILKSYADEVFQAAISALQDTLVAGADHQPEKPPITPVDRLLRELNIIIAIFKSQYSKYDPENPEAYPMVLGPDGRGGINGRYIQHMDISSEVELFNLQEFKRQMTERFEAASNHRLLENQLIEIHERALEGLNFFNQKLTARNKLVDDFLKDQERPLEVRIHELEKYHAIVTVHPHYISSIVFGTDRSALQEAGINLPIQPFNYIADNARLAQICGEVIAFIEKFNIIAVNDRSHGYYEAPHRFFSFNLNTFHFQNDPDLTAAENIKSRFQQQQIVLETKFNYAFKQATESALVPFLEEQYLLTPAPKADFLNYVELLGNRNLERHSAGANLKKADIFRVWLNQKRAAEGPVKTVAATPSPVASIFRKPALTEQYLNVLKVVKPPIVSLAGHYILGERSKSAVVAWFDVLQREHRTDPALSPDVKTKLINELIPGLDITKRTLSNPPSRAYHQYYNDLERLIKQI
ncbi:hypothetical protein ABDD95_07765 [Mucilaginibacter sp. PAMB04274]|uniref:hypothetical protein n=1 Tax=Mucilaginibacter sp. PAMB04274 TaxID=3138568 RepID=UPI0031F6B47F